MGEVIFREVAERSGAVDRFAITSRGTSDYHVGNGADPRTVEALDAAGYDGRAHRAAQLSDQDIADTELLIALDRGHERIMLERGAARDQVRLLTSYDPERPDDPDVFDPYYSDYAAFVRVLEQIERSCAVLLDELHSSQPK